MDDYRQLLGEIAHCSVANAIRLGNSSVFVPCSKVVNLQSGQAFQLPEPWSGQINNAPLLFISSNPSIDELEVYPDESWEDRNMIDFFQERFTSNDGWVVNGRALQRTGSRGRAVAFWGHARNRAQEILQKDIKPGIDFALTEVVHCKSRKEHGVSEARDFCSERYLEKVLGISVAKVLIVYGKHAEESIHRCLGPWIMLQERGLSLVTIRNILRMLIFLPHPSAYGSGKTVKEKYGDVGLRLIRAHVVK